MSGISHEISNVKRREKNTIFAVLGVAVVVVVLAALVAVEGPVATAAAILAYLEGRLEMFY